MIGKRKAIEKSSCGKKLQEDFLFEENNNVLQICILSVRKQNFAQNSASF